MKQTIIFNLMLFLSLNYYSFGIINIGDGVERTVNHEIDEWLWVDYQKPGMTTTLNIIPGGKISRLTAYEDSIIKIKGGAISYSLSNMTDSGSLLAHGRSQIIMENGSVNKYFDVSDNSSAIIYGGSIGNRLDVSGGARATVYNAVISRLGATQSGNIEFWDGSVSWQIYAGHSATITLHGTDFTLDGIPIGQTTITSIYNGLYYNEPVRRLVGHTRTGGTIAADLYIGGSAKVIIASIPEPCTLLLLAVGGMLIRKRQ